MPSASFAAQPSPNPSHAWSDPLEVLPGIGPKRAGAFAEIGVQTVGDLLRLMPTRYEDRRRRTPIADLCEEGRFTVRGTLRSIRHIRLRGGKNLADARMEDETGSVRVTWFGRGYLARSLAPGTCLLCTGLVTNRRGLTLSNPEFDVLEPDSNQDDTPGILPRYRSPDGVGEATVRALIAMALDTTAPVEDPLPRFVRDRRSFPDIERALHDLHRPNEMDAAERARERFFYERQFLLQLDLLRERESARTRAGTAHRRDGPLVTAMRKSLPFDLTRGQCAAVDEILDDMASDRPMTRLLQGDVGSGKTVVAATIIAACLDSAKQAALMAPTEVLAQQHYTTLSAYLNPLGVAPVLVTGSSTVHERCTAASAQVVVGTHAIAETAFEFEALGLAIIDEQHRFGVHQRERLAGKGRAPDVLHMTATPIPRSLCLTLYGAMDLTIIPDKPAGRRPVSTRRVPPEKEKALWRFIAGRARSGTQTYVVCPRIEGTDKGKISATRRFETLASGPLRDLRCGLLHGRMNPDEKHALLSALRTGAIDVLVTTTVIEVGVDAPNAGIIVVEDAASFGLSQLHQLRGRVGRNDREAYCFLLGDPATEDGVRRLETLCETDDGFAIAEADFKFRGPGEMRGFRQTGLSAIDGATDAAYITAVRRDAVEWLQASGARAR